MGYAIGGAVLLLSAAAYGFYWPHRGQPWWQGVLMGMLFGPFALAFAVWPPKVPPA